jgi:quinol monooxygenase YgiN
MILIELIFDAPPGQRESVIALANGTMAATRQEDGCILYRFTTVDAHVIEQGCCSRN